MKSRKTGHSNTFDYWLACWQYGVYFPYTLENPTLLTMTRRPVLSSRIAPATAWTVKALELGGYPVRQEVRMGPMLTWSEFVSVEDKPAPSGTYEVPDGYSGCE